MSLDSCDAYTLVKQFQQLQEERVYTYHLFNEGHKIYYLSSGKQDFVRFSQLVQYVTEQLKRISLLVLNIEKILRDTLQLTSVANLIAAIQEEEKKKLELTVSLQQAQQGFFANDNKLERNLEVMALRNQLKEVLVRTDKQLQEALKLVLKTK